MLLKNNDFMSIVHKQCFRVVSLELVETVFSILIHIANTNTKLLISVGEKLQTLGSGIPKV